jgi:hypothetical protein
MRTWTYVVLAVSSGALGAGCARQAAQPPLATSVAAVPESAAPPPSAGTAGPSALAADLARAVSEGIAAAAASRRAGEVQRAVAQIRALEATASTAEKALLERAARLVERMQDRSFTPEDAYVELRAVTLGMAALSPDDADAQVSATWTMFQLADRIDTSRREQRLVNESMTRAEALLARYPERAPVHEMIATFLWRTHADPLRVLRELKRCKALDPKFDCDAEVYRGTALLYELPRCAAADLRPDVAVFTASDGGKTAEHPRPIKIGARDVWIAATPVLTAPDIAAVGSDEHGLVIDLTPEGLARSAPLVGWTVVLVAGAPVAGGSYAAVSEHKLILQEGSFNDVASLCRHVERRKVPAELGPTL